MSDAPDKIQIGISTCLLGHNVRYDGGHKRHRYLADLLGRWVEWVPVCPEVDCGLTVPREAMRLVGEPRAPRLLTTVSGRDLTDRMLGWVGEQLQTLAQRPLCGFVFKSGSPSCGLEGVKLHDLGGAPIDQGAGLFADAFTARFALLPVVQESQLDDPAVRERFTVQLFTSHRWHELCAGPRTQGRLAEFHAQHKLLLMSHSLMHYSQLGRLVASGQLTPPAELYAAYHQGLMAALELRATRAKQVNVLQHLLGYFKQDLSGDERGELLEALAEYREGRVPLVVPLTLINQLVRRHDLPFLGQQVYLRPHPGELMLRNHA